MSDKIDYIELSENFITKQYGSEEEIKELDEQSMTDWSVSFEPKTVSGTEVTDKEIVVQARSAREAITKAAKSEFGLDKDAALSLDTKKVSKK